MSAIGKCLSYFLSQFRLDSVSDMFLALKNERFLSKKKQIAPSILRHFARQEARQVGESSEFLWKFPAETEPQELF
jgi:hypothetical protein